MRIKGTALGIAAAISILSAAAPASALSPLTATSIVFGASVAMWAGIIAGYQVIMAGCPYSSSPNHLYDVGGALGDNGTLATNIAQTCGQAILAEQRSLANEPGGVVAVQPNPFGGWNFLGNNSLQDCHSFFNAQLSSCILGSECLGNTMPLYCVSNNGINPPAWATVKNWDHAATSSGGYGWQEP